MVRLSPPEIDVRLGPKGKIKLISIHQLLVILHVSLDQRGAGLVSSEMKNKLHSHRVSFGALSKRCEKPISLSPRSGVRNSVSRASPPGHE
jgi:hypothetical protein